jgi:acetyl esterase/lipase
MLLFYSNLNDPNIHFKSLIMRKFLHFTFLLALVCGATSAFAQRYLDEVFTNDDIIVSMDNVFATNIDFMTSVLDGPNTATDIGTLSFLVEGDMPIGDAYYDVQDESTDIKVRDIAMDIYYPDPAADTVAMRPVIIYVHTGNFLPPPLNGSTTGLKTDSAAVNLCMQWAKRGYVAVSCDYRLGWNPLATTVQERRGTLLNAVYRAIHDVKMGVRYLRADAMDANMYNIDESKMVVYGQGSGGYVSTSYMTLDNAAEELFLEKFLPNPFDASMSYVDTLMVGGIDGWGYSNSVNLYRDNGISADVAMTVNAGGALADESWLEAGDAPMVSFNTVRDDFAPFDQGTVIVPTTQEEVVDVHGANFFIQKANDLGNNDVFAGIPDGDAYTDAARAMYGETYDVSNGGTITVNETPEGLYPLVRPLASFLTNESAPWEWWDPNSPIATTVIDPETGATAHLASLQSNPDMSPEKGLAYLDTIQGYMLPRVMCALDLPENLCAEEPVSVEELTSAVIEIYPNPTNGQVTITSNTRIDQMTIYNVVGKVVQNVSAPRSSQIVADLSKYPSGMYIVTAKTGDIVITERLIKE